MTTEQNKYKLIERKTASKERTQQLTKARLEKQAKRRGKVSRRML